MSLHTIRCKRYGIELAIKTDGGFCMCPTSECRMEGQPEIERLKKSEDIKEEVGER
jgi:hypothetical protein